MSIVSTNPRGPQQESSVITDLFPDIIPFDAASDDGPDDGPDDQPPAGCGGLVIRLSGAEAVVEPGFTVAAIEDDPDSEDPRSFQFVSHTLPLVNDACRIAGEVASHPRGLLIPATHVVVHDHRGVEVFSAPINHAA